MEKKSIIAIVILCLMVAVVSGVVTYKYLDNKNNSQEEKKPNEPEKEEPKPEPTKYTDTDYNINLIKTVNSSQNGNYLISPYSIEIALQMLRDGANGESKNQIDKVIGNRNIPVFNAKGRISVTNGAFIKNDYKDFVKDSYYKKLAEYKAELLFDKFATPKVINDWVNKNTYKMIPKILDEMSPDFVLGIANAVAIDVEWWGTFKCERTRKEEFTKSDGSKMNAEMMNSDYADQYFEIDGAKGVVLKYFSYDENGEKLYENQEKGTQLEFVGILPDGNAKDFVSGLTKEKLDSIDKNYKDISNKDFHLGLPRFKYEFKLEDFMEVLKTMGIEDVFSPLAADLTNIIARDDFTKMDAENLYVSTAIHQTYIDLNEKGTRAAAITYFGIDKAGIAPMERERIELIFNKPFVYMIRDSKTKEILFFGVVETPNEWKGSTCGNE